MLPSLIGRGISGPDLGLAALLSPFILPDLRSAAGWEGCHDQLARPGRRGRGRRPTSEGGLRSERGGQLSVQPEGTEKLEPEDNG